VGQYSDLEIQYLTWEDVRDRLAAGYRTVVFAVGATEQHGPQLPIGTDDLRGTAAARLVAEELGNTLVAPTIRPGHSPEMMDFPGTITLRDSTLAAIIVDYCTSLVAHGFETLVVMSAHGGNNAIIQMAAYEAQQAVGKRAVVIPITDFIGYYDSGYDKHKEGYHGGRMETSFMLSLAPELVHMDRVKEWTNPVSREIKDVGALLRLAGIKHFAPYGAPGHAAAADAKVGEEALRQIARNMADQVRLVLSHLR
jgi:creatinine amidohydrolase